MLINVHVSERLDLLVEERSQVREKYKKMNQHMYLLQNRIQKMVKSLQSYSSVSSSIHESAIIPNDIPVLFTDTKQSLAPGVPGWQAKILLSFICFFNLIYEEQNTILIIVSQSIIKNFNDFSKKLAEEQDNLLKTYNKINQEWKSMVKRLTKQNELVDNLHQNVIKVYEKTKFPTKSTREMEQVVSQYYSAFRELNSMAFDLTIIHADMLRVMNYATNRFIEKSVAFIELFKVLFRPIKNYLYSSSKQMASIDFKTPTRDLVHGKDLKDFVLNNNICRISMPPMQEQAFICPGYLDESNEDIFLYKAPFDHMVPLFVCTSKYDYYGEGPCELSFNKGDHICIFDPLEQDWCLAYIKNDKKKLGFVPSGALKVETRPKAIANTPHVVIEKDEIVIQAGDILIILDEGEKVFYCENMDGVIGTVDKSRLNFF